MFYVLTTFLNSKLVFIDGLSKTSEAQKVDLWTPRKSVVNLVNTWLIIFFNVDFVGSIYVFKISIVNMLYL